MYPAGGESYQKFAVVLLTVLSFWQIWADLLNTFFESREKCAHLISASLNRPFPSSPGSLFQKKGRCSAFDMEIIFHFHANKTHFHKGPEWFVFHNLTREFIDDVTFGNFRPKFIGVFWILLTYFSKLSIYFVIVEPYSVQCYFSRLL